MRLIKQPKYSVLLILLICVLSSCGRGSLRGEQLIFLRFPIQNNQEEAITLGLQKDANRSFLPVNVKTHINRVTVPEKMWTDLENLRQSWCAHPEEHVSQIPKDTDFEVVVRCETYSDIHLAFTPGELPQPLRDLINFAPSTSERLIVN